MSNEDQSTTAGPTVLQAGREFGPYRVEALLGVGGMAQVFRARDTRLNRSVAIKVCQERFSERFGGEARAIAALNHPHICTLYDVGPDFLVMELVEGETLTAQIRRGPLPLDSVLKYGAQMADALAEAHNAGIVHRDFKPGNIMITRHGVKVLDFGLAKIEGRDATVTGPFVVMGTPAYMAPEQIAGESVGPRSDLFALGLVLYEMTTGKRPLPDTSLGQALLGSSTAVAPVSKTRAEASTLDGLIARLLAADPSKRPSSAAAVAAELHAMITPGSRSTRAASIAGIAAVVVLGIAGSWWLASRTDEPVRLEVAEIVPITNLSGDELDPAYSPDGASVAFSWRGQDGKSPGIYLLDRDAAVPRRLTNAQSAIDDVAPAWSPDGTQIAFERLTANGPNELIVVNATSGVERKVRDVTQSSPLANTSRPLLTWTPDGGAIVVPTLDVDTGGRASLFRIGLHGEPAQRLFESTGGDGDGYPAFSPDGQWLAYASVERNSTRLFVRRMGRDGLPEGPPQEVPEGVGTLGASLRSPMWSPDSRRLLFTVAGKLLEWEPGGTARELWVSSARFQAVTAHWTDGVLSRLLYATTVGRTELRELRLDPTGRHAEGPPVEFMHLGSITSPQFSPDGRWLTFSSQGGLWIATANGENPRLLVNMIAGSGTHFSPDSRHVAFHKPDEEFAPLYVVDLDNNGVAAAVRKVAQTKSFGLAGASWSADGKYLYTTNINKTPQRVMRARVSDGQLDDLFDGATPVVSADEGRRIFYRKGLGVSPLFARSLDGDVTRNLDEELIPGCVMVFGIVPTSRGIYYVACDEKKEPVQIRFFEFSSRRSFDVGPPPIAAQPILTVSLDGRRLLYQTTLPGAGELTRVSFRRAKR